MEAVKLKGVSFAYPKSEYNALSDVSFSLEKGSFSLVMGASAAGKSTLLSLLKRELAPFGVLSGEIEIAGTVGYVSQYAEESIVCDRVRSELAFGVQNLGKSSAEIELLIAETAAYFHLEDRLNLEVSQLSGGEKQLVCLAAVMMMKPDVLVLDEPCAMLDPVAAERFVNMVKKLHRDLGITVILSEHSTDLLYSYADYVLLLERGRLPFLGTPEQMVTYLKNTESPMLAAVPMAYRLRGRELKLRAQSRTDATPAPVLTAKGIWFAYHKGQEVLSDLSLKVYQGRINALIGCNGCGKTTLLKVLSKVLKGYRGSVRTKGSAAMLTQNVKDIFTKETCAEEVNFGTLTDYLEIADIADRHPYDLSGGQAQRLALAKVLERGTELLLLDEPTKGFDAELKQKLGALLKQLCSEGKTVLLASHDLDFVGEWADYVSFMSEGKIAVTADTKSVFSSLSFYTTSLSRLTGGKAVSMEDLSDE